MKCKTVRQHVSLHSHDNRGSWLNIHKSHSIAKKKYHIMWYENEKNVIAAVSTSTIYIYDGRGLAGVERKRHMAVDSSCLFSLYFFLSNGRNGGIGHFVVVSYMHRSVTVISSSTHVFHNSTWLVKPFPLFFSLPLSYICFFITNFLSCLLRMCTMWWWALSPEVRSHTEGDWFIVDCVWCF